MAFRVAESPNPQEGTLLAFGSFAGKSWRVECHGKAYLVTGSDMDDHGDAHAADGLCNVAREAVVEGKIEGDNFVSAGLELRP